jgi:hypothetical protein
MADNSDPKSKIVLRQWLLKEMGGAPNTRVMELYAGMGDMYDSVYTDVKKHIGFELRKVDRPTWLQGDNRTLLKTRVNGWDLYDLDAYASPWQLANDICRMREPGRYAMALTCGMNRSLCTGVINGFIRQKIGLKGMGHGVGLLYRWYFDIARWMMLDWEQHGVKVIKAKHIDSTATNWIHYFGVIVEKSAPPATAPKIILPGKLKTI